MLAGLAPGTILGARYRIVRLLAEGGMGAVYEAEHLLLDRRVALKTLLPEFQDEPRLVQRFVREARATCTIAHHNVVNVLDIDQTPDGIIFFVMEYLEGADLLEVLEREGRLPWQRVQRIAVQICAALEAAHERGIVHRDLKPSNCFLLRDDNGADRIKLLDFGVAKVLESSGSRGLDGRSARNTGRDLRWLKTTTGEVFGTLAYMAPEHLNGAPHDHRVDIYALGVILYEALTGAPPYSPDSPGTYIQQVLFDTPDPPSVRAPTAKIPPDLDYVVLRALEKRPEDRFATMQEFAEALSAVRPHAAPAIAASPLVLVPPTPIVGAAPAPAAAPPPAAPAPTRAPLGILAGLALLGVCVLALALRLTLRDPDPPTPAPAVTSPTAQTAEPRTPTPEPTPEPTAPAPPEPALPEPEPTPGPTAPAPTEPPPEPAAPAPAKPSGKSSRPRTPPPPAPPMNITPFDRQRLFAAHRDTLTRQCKRPHRLKNAILVLQITIENAKITRAALEGERDRDRQAAARCIEAYLRSSVKVPGRYSGRATFSYAF